ncbi:PREDICTED: uncharacterized protein LOC107342573 [Acropora digitifera]|uniref:uncharacterized protein LOC107342573 n=1 Tax=Acropora digitifera TaxID=70779 RepID=UPI00077A6E1B|nr:PREDICTED: uncharacterized protein LOC107342573 [Acropora digitifera]
MKVFLKILPVTLLTEVVCGQFCTKETLDCSKAVPAITKLGSHSCACDDEMHSGALKFDRGNLYVCLEKQWEPVKLISHAQTDYGFHQENPGTSCNDILAKADGKTLKNGVYWIKESSTPLGRETFKVYCDMETGPGGWTMVFKLNTERDSETTMSYLQIFEATHAVEEDNAGALSTKRNNDISGYKSRIMTREFFPEFNPSKAKIVLYQNDKSQKELLFNAKSADAATWFWHSKLTTSSWSDLDDTRFNEVDSKSFFSIRNGWYGKNLFIISKKELVECGSNEGWLRVLEEGEGCANSLQRDTSGIYFSKKTTATLWSEAEGVGEADVLAVFLQ